ncbi:hypothetical protein XFF6992_10011 [Xanthomonas citri pv. fuscans]|nr:hypothetical protein XFF6990_210011 [Xanthomonas citri pv. fuscans]SOO16994.1 hypothetical protein XFF6992_10011 [Xanthomonas citri pv. fuscans]SOO35627.1 hypothetical protein XFF6994_550002 [Xanthomonas citri pv. fuscans]
MFHTVELITQTKIGVYENKFSSGDDLSGAELR